jgi:signal transduction histidine kinase
VCTGDWGKAVASEAREEADTAMEENKRKLPLWVSNLLLFALLSFAAVGYFFWQIHRAEQEFFDHVRVNVKQVADVIELSARGAVVSQQVAEELLEALLGNTARFVDYLDSIEPFSSEELSAFAKESGLVGIRIFGDEDKYAEGPPKWSQDMTFNCTAKATLEHRAKQSLYLFSWPRKDAPGCVVLGIEDKKIASLEEQLGLENVIKTISELPRIRYVKMGNPSAEGGISETGPAVAIMQVGGSQVAETRLPFGSRELVVGVDTRYLASAIHRLWRDFFVFGVAFALLGTFLSFILYRQQTSHLAQVKSFERRISKEREDASLGRAAAGIAHEIRNPLNALGMGLQRLQLEGDELRDEHRHLVVLMMDAIHRADGSVSGLLNYARPQMPNRKPTRLDLLVKRTLALYSPRCEDLHIKVAQKIDFKETISADPELLGQVIENLLINAIEAQPDGGFLHLEVGRKEMEIYLKIRNGGANLPAEETDRIFEPYFTTKTEGTGLGLTISQRIVQAHVGRLEARTPEAGLLEITVYLPLTGN